MLTNLNRVKSYFKANPAAVFIVAFQVLLLSAAAILVSGNANSANEIATYAFYALVVGIAIQAITSVRERRKHSQPDDGNGSKSS